MTVFVRTEMLGVLASIYIHIRVIMSAHSGLLIAAPDVLLTSDWHMVAENTMQPVLGFAVFYLLISRLPIVTWAARVSPPRLAYN